MEGNNAYLPHEIIINILKRLPVKSLIRFQCVCKNWKSLLKDALFIADHLHHSSHRPSLLLPRCYNYRRQLHLYSFNCDYRFCKFDTSSLIDYLSSLTTNVDPYLFRIAGSSNGLLCVLILDYSLSPHKLLVWNPATKEVREVPTRTLDFKSPDRFSIGFGFSTIANDYKIVNISVSNKNRDYRGHVDRAEVYSLGTGLWKEVEFGSLLEGTRLYCGSSTGDGIVFWVGQKQSDGSLMIVSFDLTMEEFRFIPMPPLEPMLTTIPTFYENKPAIISYHKRGTSESGVIHLWDRTRHETEKQEADRETVVVERLKELCFLTCKLGFRERLLAECFEHDSQISKFPDYYMRPYEA
ncbi:putative F-box protein At4g38870 [Neltuma alba]|uniref:putative F-box protein At4g38870 n=1 Tax=Neltuma alba TaxID=207710 RepID=UPI0010A4D3AA|nr:putative F-box protein At4g38870 [Prosopis alba]